MAVELRYLLDANVIISALDGAELPLLARLSACPIGSLATSSIAFAESLVKVVDDGRRNRLDRLYAQVEVLPFDESAARIYAELPFKRRGFDRLIGAHALSLDLTVVSANSIDFRDIPNLRVEDWTRP